MIGLASNNSRTDNTLAILNDPRLDSVFAAPTRIGVDSPWYGHLPFARWIVGALRPSVLVELGTHDGVSYAGFCDAIQTQGLPTRAHAIDTRHGDPRPGSRGDDSGEDFQSFHASRYSAFSTLTRASSDAARSRFADGSIDLLHIDGEPSYASVRHDFEHWLPKLSDRAVVLVHDTGTNLPGFGVWQFWRELAGRYPGFEFPHASGLGVLAVGANVPDDIVALCNLRGTEAARLRERFAMLGTDWSAPAGAGRLPSAGKHPEGKRPKGKHWGTGGPGMPRIGVVIPLYNGGPFIEQALRSVLDQTLAPAEIIVVDDGSKDDGPAIVERLAADHPITLIRQPNAGQSAARNHGITQSTSELIALLDQDDVWYPHHLEELVQPFLEPRQSELGWVYSNLDEIDRDNNMVSYGLIHRTPGPHPKRDLVECLRADMFVVPTACLFSRKAFLAVGGFDELLSGYEDDDFFLRLFRAGYDNVFVHESLARWRQYTESSSYSPRMARSRMIYLRKLLALFPDDPRRGRYYARDCLAPRFLPWIIREYTLALREGTAEQIQTAWQDLRFVTGLHRLRVRVFLAPILPLLRFPSLARPLLCLKIGMRPLTRRVLR